MLSVAPADPRWCHDAARVEAITAVVNEAYRRAEDGLWRRDLPRTTLAEVAARLAAGQLVVALDEDVVVGAVFTELLSPDVGWFGALAAAPARAGRGIGTQLVAACEAAARAAGAVEMQLEVLAPAPPHPHTTRLAAWYARLGYVEQRRESLLAMEPELADWCTASACDFVTCRRPLVDAPVDP